MAQKYTKKPLTIEAVKVTQNFTNIMKFCKEAKQEIKRDGDEISIVTREGVARAKQGDWIIKGINGEYYPCSDDIFKRTYQKAK